MICGGLKSTHPVTVSPGFDRPIVIHGVRDAGWPSAGEPIRLMLNVPEAIVLMEGLQKILNAQIVPPPPPRA